MKLSNLIVAPLTAVLAILLVFAYVQVFPVDWGTLSFKPGRTVTVYGQAQQQQRNQFASFSVGVQRQSDDKQEAVSAVNAQMSAVIEQIKQFGIAQDDIETQSVSIVDTQNRYGQEMDRPRWEASNSINITLRNGDRASDLTNLLAQTDAAYVHGPNFRLDPDANPEDELIGAAIEDAREKANRIAQKSGAKLGKVLQVDETGESSNRVLPMMGGAEGLGGGAPIEPGTTRVSKTVLVVFELK